MYYKARWARLFTTQAKCLSPMTLYRFAQIFAGSGLLVWLIRTVFIHFHKTPSKSQAADRFTKVEDATLPGARLR
jgi:hypothetical protein